MNTPDQLDQDKYNKFFKPGSENYFNNHICNRIKVINVPPMTAVWIKFKPLKPTQSGIHNFGIDQPKEPTIHVIT